MSAITEELAKSNGLKTVENNGDGTGALHVVMDAQGANAPASAAAVSTVASSDTVVTLLAANTARRGVFVYNGADKNLMLKFGSGASSSSFTMLVLAGASFQFPTPIYQGIVTGIWAAGPTGNAVLTELT